MPEYIERENALEITKRTSGDYATAFSMIRRLPAADVAPVVRGKWIVNPKREYDYICSVCGGDAPENRWANNDALTSYCPNCGAKMDELKPCPFCGGKARSTPNYKTHSQKVRYVVKCTKCNAIMKYRSEKDAKEAWNRRANDER